MRRGLDVSFSGVLWLVFGGEDDGVEREERGGKARVGVLGDEWWLMNVFTVSPLDLLKNPMILIAVVGLGVVVGMPYLMDNSGFLFSLFLYDCGTR